MTLNVVFLDNFQKVAWNDFCQIYIILPGDGQPGNNVNVADSYLPEIQIIMNIAFRVMNIATLMIGCITKMITKVKVPDKVSMLGEDLHPRPLIASIANHKLARAFHHRNLEGKRDWKY